MATKTKSQMKVELKNRIENYQFCYDTIKALSEEKQFSREEKLWIHCALSTIEWMMAWCKIWINAINEFM